MPLKKDLKLKYIIYQKELLIIIMFWYKTLNINSDIKQYKEIRKLRRG